MKTFFGSFLGTLVALLVAFAGLLYLTHHHKVVNTNCCNCTCECDCTCADCCCDCCSCCKKCACTKDCKCVNCECAKTGKKCVPDCNCVPAKPRPNCCEGQNLNPRKECGTPNRPVVPPMPPAKD